MQAAARAHGPAETRAGSVRDGHVDYVLHELEQAARGVDTAFALSNAMEAVARHHRAKCRITPRQREELLGAIVRAQLSALKHLPTSYRREQIDVGMQALAGQVMVWAETFERTTQRKQHALADLNAYARMFRNDLHNISLTEEVARRAWERRNAQIQDLMLPAAG
ncbi:putative nucleic acid-binding protein [Bradyrhizobium sp. LB7.1]